MLMRFEIALVGPLLAALALATPAVALEESSVPENLLGFVGEWRLEQEDQTLPTCGLTFTEDQAVAGWAIAFTESCLPPFPPVDRMAAWSIDDTTGAVLITDNAGKVTLRFIEAEDGLYVTEPGVARTFYLMLPYDDGGTGGEIGDEVME
jgi:hypothetical protein